jgi:branched-subunit amino acid transport protein
MNGGLEFVPLDPLDEAQTIPQLVNDTHAIDALWAALYMLATMAACVLLGARWLRAWLWRRSAPVAHALDVLRKTRYFSE